MKKKKSSFAGKISRNIEHQKQQSSASYGYLNLPKGVNVLKEQEGRMWLDFMPYQVTIPNHPDRDEEFEVAVEGSLWWRFPFKIHRNVGNDSIVCPSTFGKRCPVCEYRTKRLKEGAEKEETDLLRISNRNLYVVIPRKSKKFEEKPYIWDISQYLFQELLNQELLEDETFEQFPDLEAGYTLKIRFEERKIGTNAFQEATRIDFEEREEAYDESILKTIPCLDSVLKVLSYKEIEAKLFEIEAEPTEEDEPVRKKKVVQEEEEDDEPAPPVRKKKSVPEPEEEEDDDDDEPTPPVRKKKVVQEEEEDDDEPTPPVRKKKSEPTQAPGKKKKCPYGHQFGVDTDEKSECDDCDLWNECIDEKDAK